MNAQSVPELSYGEIVWVPREAYDAALRRAEIAEGQARLNAQTSHRAGSRDPQTGEGRGIAMTTQKDTKQEAMATHVVTNQMTTAVNRSWSKDELIEAARNYMLEQYGIPREMIDQENKDRWRERLGLLVDFVNVLWDDPT